MRAKRSLRGTFLGVFVGTAVLAGICVLAGFFPWGETRSVLLLLAGICYLMGSFGVIAAFNGGEGEEHASDDSGTDAHEEREGLEHELLECAGLPMTPIVRHERRAKGREAAFGTSARWRG